MRIMHISSNYTDGIVSRLHEEMLRDGDDTVVYYGFGELSNIPKTFRFNSEFSIKLYDFLARLTGKQGCFSAYPTFILKRRIREFRPEIVHIHGLNGNHFHYFGLLRFLKDRKYKVVLTIDDDFLLTETGKEGEPTKTQELFDGFDRVVIALKNQELYECFENSILKDNTLRLAKSALDYRRLYREIKRENAERYHKKMYAGK